MSQKIRFEANEDTRETDEAIDNNTTKSRRNLRKFGQEASPIDDKPQVNAAPVQPTGAAFSPTGVSAENIGMVGDVGSQGIAGLQHGTANLLRNITPDETTDRNTAVSAVKFGMEVGATYLGKAAANQKAKRKSKLKTEDSTLKFDSEEAKTENSENDQSQDADEVEQPDKGDTADEAVAEADGDSVDDAVTDDADKKPSTAAPDATDATADIPEVDTPIPPAADKPDSKLKFTKDEKAVIKSEKKAEKSGEKLDKAKDKLPTKKVKKEQLVFDGKKNKSVTKLTHDKEVIPIGEAKWNKPKDVSTQAKAVSVVSSLTVTKVHTKIHQVEHENVGVKVAHKGELLAESSYRGAKQSVKSAYRHHKNRSYRKVAKLEQKSIKNNIKLDYQKALRDNPKLKSNPLSRMMQKRAIKRNYAKDLKNAKKAAAGTKKAVGFTAKAGKAITAILRKNPVFLVKAGLLLLIVFLIMSMLSMCVGIFSGGTAVTGAVAYAAEHEDINDASILYTELETDLQVTINNIESDYPGYDEYRINTGIISHNPFELMAFLTAVYQDFTFSEVEAVIRAIFNEQYTLNIVPEVEIRTRMEERTGTGSYTDSEGNSHSYTYTYYVEVEYEYHILNVTMTALPMSSVLAARMNADQTQHYGILMYSNGARQMVGNPFDFDWLANITSLYGYRIHPISGVKQFHWGIDIGLPTGTPILAGLTGKVVAVGYDAGGYGNYVVIEDENGLQARYAHCHDVLVSDNQPVEKGDVIATVGNTGASTGSHLHMEVSVDGQRINPIFFVETGNEGKAPSTMPGTPGGIAIPEYPGAPMDDARFAAIMEEALKHLGKPYVWGASGPNSFDCSGFVWYVLNQSGVASFGRTTASQIFNLTTPIAKENLQPGDLVFLTGTYSSPGPISHIAIYIGNGNVIHAGNPVSYASINSAYWEKHYYVSGRLP